MNALTDTQAETLIAIVEFMVEQRTPTPLPPSIRDVASAIGVPSTSTVLDRVRSLQDSGYLVENDRFVGIARANTRLTHKGDLVGKGMLRTGDLMME